MTLREILNLDYNDVMKMNREELSSVVKSMRNIYNLRKGQFTRKGEDWKKIPAFKTISSFDLSGKGNINSLRNQFSKGLSFLNYKTSTYKGYSEYEETVRKNLGDNNNELSKDEISKTFDIFHKLEEDNYTLVYNMGSRVALNLIIQLINEGVDINMDEIKVLLKNKYEEMSQQENYTEEVDDFDFWNSI